MQKLHHYIKYTEQCDFADEEEEDFA